MNIDDLPVQSLDVKNATEAEYAALNRLMNRMRAESWPGDPPVPLETTKRRLQNVPPFVDIVPWIIWDRAGRELIASAGVGIFRNDNLQALGFQIEVLPSWRHNGIGRRLLGKVAEAARDEDRTLLFTNSSSNAPAGEAFLRRIGAAAGLAVHTNQLELSAVDRDLLRRWQENASERAGGAFEMGLWEGPYPEEAIDAVIAMKKAMHDMPRGDLKFEDPILTPETVREADRTMVNRRDERWTLFVRERATGQVAGYTEMYWNAERPEMLWQGDTAVFPQYRGHGLGRWLKAAMLEKAMHERPTATRVRTGNADANVAMLQINTDLGFRPYRAETVWQVERAAVEAYLAGEDRIG